MSKEEIIKVLRDMAKYPTVTLPRDSEALKAAADLLAQPEQEPVKYSDYEPDGVHHNKPPQRTWVGLTDEEINTAASVQSWKPFAKAIEAKLKQKNGFAEEKNT